MIVCYANGGGLGHLTRIRAYLHTRPPGEEPVTILTGSPFAADPRVIGGHRVRSAPPGLGREELDRWLGPVLAELNPAELVVDAFPAGLSGELSARVVPAGARVVHLARLLRWEAYRPLLPADPLRFTETVLVEPVTGEHEDYLRSMSATLTPLELAEPPAPAPPVAPGGWLVVHSGPPAETAELVAYAREIAELEGARPRVTLVSPIRPQALPPGVAYLDVYPAWPLFPYAERIITAAGCNVVRQLARFRERHHMMPFPRRFDDQFTRAARTRSRATAGRFAEDGGPA
ncbi:MAG: hypothetical protein ACRDP6_45755 [Actinoallomurus sp.]